MNAIDTNVFVYAFDVDEAVKGVRALQLIESLPLGETVLLWQVACELGAVLSRIGSRARNVRDRQAAIDSVRTRFPLVCPTENVLDNAWRLHRDLGLSYWDALLIGACLDAGVIQLFTEDIQSRPIIQGVKITNPFA